MGYKWREKRKEKRNVKKRGRVNRLYELAAPFAPPPPLLVDDQDTIAGRSTGEAAAPVSNFTRLFEPSASLSSAGRLRCERMSASKQSVQEQVGTRETYSRDIGFDIGRLFLRCERGRRSSDFLSFEFLNSTTSCSELCVLCSNPGSVFVDLPRSRSTSRLVLRQVLSFRNRLTTGGSLTSV